MYISMHRPLVLLHAHLAFRAAPTAACDAHPRSRHRHRSRQPRSPRSRRHRLAATRPRVCGGCSCGRGRDCGFETRRERLESQLPRYALARRPQLQLMIVIAIVGEYGGHSRSVTSARYTIVCPRGGFYFHRHRPVLPS